MLVFQHCVIGLSMATSFYNHFCASPGMGARGHINNYCGHGEMAWNDNHGPIPAVVLRAEEDT